jgi:hypothetical protein
VERERDRAALGSSTTRSAETTAIRKGRIFLTDVDVVVAVQPCELVSSQLIVDVGGGGKERCSFVVCVGMCVCVCLVVLSPSDAVVLGSDRKRSASGAADVNVRFLFLHIPILLYICVRVCAYAFMNHPF